MRSSQSLRRAGIEAAVRAGARRILYTSQRMLLGFFQAARQEDSAGVDPLLGELLGRTPRTVRDLLS